MATKTTEKAALPPQFQVRQDDARAWTEALATVPLFTALSQRQRRKIAETARIRRFTDGTPLVIGGHAASEFFVILEGQVDIAIPGRPRFAMGAGSFVGELAL